MMKPCININGTSRKELVEQRLNLMTQINNALDALRDMKPHGRDYVGNLERFNEDQAVWRDYFNQLDGLLGDIKLEAMEIQKEGR